ncbi:aminoacylase [Vibrio sp. T187]|uniref:aminoacylase n=1 Tax=Vibrio TaxID=662 RepID=UPI0010CA0464|nr:MULTISPECIES: aminoacylase [Vibrio]MBW3697749.1 aminoacylase [Vibrio sp. T187]
MKKLFVAICVTVGLTGCSQLLQSSDSQNYDVVILNGRVMDPETNFDAVRNVGVRDGRIVSITEKAISGVEVIDATGHVVSPGFIDTQNHGHGLAWNAKIGLRDGVTTPLDLEAGNLNVAGFYAEREGKWLVNYGAAVSHEMIRMKVLDKMDITEPVDAKDMLATLRGGSYEENDIPDWAETQSSLEQINEIMAIADEEFRQGALTAGSTMGYMAKGASTLEVFNYQKVAANYGRASSFHVRLLGNATPPYEGTLGAFEQLVNGMALDAPVLFSHNNNAGWWEIEEHAQLFRDQGKNVWSEYYPYHCGSSTIGSDFLKPEGMKLLGTGYDQMKDPRTGEPYTVETYKAQLAKDPGYTIILCFPVKEKWMAMFTEVPHMVVAGDGMPGVDIDGKWLEVDAPYEDYVGHPRTAGSHARSFAIARDNNVPLMQTIAQNSYWSAKHLGDAGLKAMQERGRMQEGMVADITIFDPKSIQDNADYVLGKNGLPSTGIPYVLVNGVIVVDDSVVQLDKTPGQPIRYDVEEKGRWVPLEKTAYLEDLLSLDFPHIHD